MGRLPVSVQIPVVAIEQIIAVTRKSAHPSQDFLNQRPLSTPNRSLG
jgi:hypothetical protein